MSQTACVFFSLSPSFCDTFAFSHYANALFSFHRGGQKYRRVLPENVTTSFQKINYQHTNENAGMWQHVKKLRVTVKKNVHFPSAAVTMATGSPLIDNSPSTSRRGDARTLYSVLQSPSCFKLRFLSEVKRRSELEWEAIREGRWEVWSIRSSFRLRSREPSSVIYNKLLNFNYTASPTFSTRSRCYKASDHGRLTGLFNDIPCFFSVLFLIF